MHNSNIVVEIPEELSTFDLAQASLAISKPGNGRSYFAWHWPQTTLEVIEQEKSGPGQRGEPPRLVLCPHGQPLSFLQSWWSPPSNRDWKSSNSTKVTLKKLSEDKNPRTKILRGKGRYIIKWTSGNWLSRPEKMESSLKMKEILKRDNSFH